MLLGNADTLSELHMLENLARLDMRPSATENLKVTGKVFHVVSSRFLSSPARTPLGSVVMSTWFFLAMRSIMALDRL